MLISLTPSVSFSQQMSAEHPHWARHSDPLLFQVLGTQLGVKYSKMPVPRGLVFQLGMLIINKVNI